MGAVEKDWGGNTRSAWAQLGASNHSEYERQNDDYYASEPLIGHLLMQAEKFKPKIWEPSCGQGHLAEVFKEYGYDVYGSDLVNRGYGEVKDFLQQTEKWDGDIITNPPYTLATEFVEHAMELVTEGSKVAMFLKIQFLESVKRYELFKKYPPKKVWVAVQRLVCARNGDFEQFSKGSAVCYSWYVWEKGYAGEPTIGWLNPTKEMLQKYRNFGSEKGLSGVEQNSLF